MAEFEIPEEDAAILFSAAGLKQYDEFGNVQELPEAIRKSYMRYKAVKDRIDMGAMTTDAYISIVVLSGWNVAAKTTVVTAATLGRSGDLKHGDPVLVKYRKKNCEAKFIGNCGDDEEVIIQLDDDSEERRVPTSTVTVPVKV